MKPKDSESLKCFQQLVREQFTSKRPGPDGMVVDFGITDDQQVYAVYCWFGNEVSGLADT